MDVQVDNKRYLYKKWLLFAFTLIASISTLVIVITSVLAINAIIDNNNYRLNPRSKLSNFTHQSSESFNLALEGNFTKDVPMVMKMVSRSLNQTGSLNDAERTARTIIISVGVVSILIQLLGMIGALKEQYCLLVTYSVFCAIIGGGNIVSAVDGAPGSWFSVVLYILISMLAYSFARDIRRRSSTQIQASIVTTNPNIIYGGQGQMYPGQTNFPVQPFNSVPGQASFPVQQFNSVPGQSNFPVQQFNSVSGQANFPVQQFSQVPGQTYANTPINPYQPFASQYPVNQGETGFNYTHPVQHRSSDVTPPPYAEQVDTKTKQEFNNNNNNL